jgi:NitT/TauT family transport system ATP-binding protein
VVEVGDRTANGMGTAPTDVAAGPRSTVHGMGTAPTDVAAGPRSTVDELGTAPTDVAAGPPSEHPTESPGIDARVAWPLGHPVRDSGSIVVRGVGRTFPRRTGAGELIALNAVDLDVAPGDFVSLVGPSGCGKSTLLMIMAGLLEATSGQVTIDGATVAGPRRSVGLMFQTPELFPWRNVLENVLLPVDVFKWGRGRHLERAQDLLRLVGLEGFERAHTYELSGGMQQRAALCRVLMGDPGVILMDEPFGALDEFTRERLNLELLHIWESTGKTIVFVTHNIGEAVFLSSRVVVMGTSPGRVLRVVPIDLPRPRTFSVLRDPEYNARVFEIRELLGVGR